MSNSRITVIAALFASLLFVSCATSSGVQRLGPDTFSVSSTAHPARGGYSEARGIALAEANQYCAQLGKEIVVTNIGTATTNSADITFRCLAKGDPDLQRPEYRRAPDTVIEDRRR